METPGSLEAILLALINTRTIPPSCSFFSSPTLAILAQHLFHHAPNSGQLPGLRPIHSKLHTLVHSPLQNSVVCFHEQSYNFLLLITGTHGQIWAKYIHIWVCSRGRRTAEGGGACWSAVVFCCKGLLLKTSGENGRKGAGSYCSGAQMWRSDCSQWLWSVPRRGARAQCKWSSVNSLPDVIAGPDVVI